MNKLRLKKERFERRKKRVKKKVRRNTDYPRLCITKSNKSIYVQLIDDVKGETLIGMSTLAKDFPAEGSRGNVESAKKLGELFAKKASEKGITKAVFDRNGYLYHGKVKAFADAVRENGVEI